MSILNTIRTRINQTDDFLSHLKAIERENALGIKLYGDLSTIATARASIYIMIYNIAEFALSHCIQDIRTHISENVDDIGRLHSFWKTDIVNSHFKNALSQGTKHTNHIEAIVNFLPGRIEWGNGLDEIPFAGNIDSQTFFRFIKSIDHKWTPPKSTLGGLELDAIRKKRNDLAHGRESFEAIGSTVSTDELKQTLHRIEKFVTSFVRCLDTYTAKNGFLIRRGSRPHRPPLHPARKPVEPAHSVGHPAGG